MQKKYNNSNLLLNGLFQKKIPSPPPPPDGWDRFYAPLTPGFPEPQDPPSFLDFQDKRPPPWEKIIRLKFNLFLIENMHNHG